MFCLLGSCDLIKIKSLCCIFYLVDSGLFLFHGCISNDKDCSFRSQDGTWTAEEIFGRRIWKTQIVTAGRKTAFTIQAHTPAFFLRLSVWWHNTWVCFFVLVMMMCSGSGGHTDIPEPQLEWPSQALWGGAAQKYRWTDCGSAFSFTCIYVSGCLVQTVYLINVFSKLFSGLNIFNMYACVSVFSGSLGPVSAHRRGS